MNEPFHYNTVLSKITQSIVLAYQALAVVVFIASLFIGYNWLQNPFIGGLFEQTLVLNGSDTGEAGKHWALYEAGFKIGDQLVSVNGQPISSGRDLGRTLRSLAIGQTVPVVMRTAAGEERTVDITLQALSGPDQLSYFLSLLS